MSTLADVEKLSAGAAFHRCDMHIHSWGGSHDVKDVGMTPQAIVDTAVREKLAIIAVTDHNEITNVRETVAYAAVKGILAVPGVELSTSHGHLLVYMRTVDALTRYYHSLDIVDHGTANSRCQTAMLDCLKRIPKGDGFAILAHVDGPKGLEHDFPGGQPHKADIFCHEALLGIELKNAKSDVAFSHLDPDGERAKIAKRRNLELGLGEKVTLARVQFSDAHNLAALGHNAQGDRRVTRMKAERPSFDALVLALRDADARVRIEDEIPSQVPRILGLHVEGGFLDGSVVHLSPNLNCIIGGRGAGKSTLFELLRTLAPSPSHAGVIDSEVWPTTTTLWWQDPAGTTNTLRRGHGGVVENVSDPTLGLTTFPIDCYGQGETAETSNAARTDVTGLRVHLDRYIAFGDLRARDEALCTALGTNQATTDDLTIKVSVLSQCEQKLASIKAQLAELEKADAKKFVELQRQLATERQIRGELDEVLKEAKRLSGEDPITEIVSLKASLPAKETITVGRVEFEAILAELDKWEGAAADPVRLLRLAALGAEAAIRGHVAEWRRREIEKGAEIDLVKAELVKNGIKLEERYINQLTTEEAKYTAQIKDLKLKLVQIKELAVERRKLNAERRSVLADIRAARDAFAVRTTRALKDSLGDLTVTLRYDAGKLSPDAARIIQQQMGWRTNAAPKASAIVQHLGVQGLLDAVAKQDATGLVAMMVDGSPVFTASDAKDVLARLGQPPTLALLERCGVHDRPRMSITKPPAGGGKPMTRDFAKLSLGQQQSILLAIMLGADSTSPLLIDQPEDNLDSEFIYHSLVAALRKAKERRQVIVVTHNANIAVLGDAEQIVSLKGLSDRGIIVATGSIDDDKSRTMACMILEGTEEAFVRRAQIYGVRK